MRNLWIDLNTSKVIVCRDNHFVTMFENAHLFETSQDAIRTLCSIHKERIGQEGKVRDYYVKDALLRGYARVIYLSRQATFIVQCNTISQCTRATKLLREYLEDMNIEHREIQSINLNGDILN